MHLDISHLGGGVGGFSLGPLPLHTPSHHCVDLKEGGAPPPPVHQDICLYLELCTPVLPLQEATPAPHLPWAGQYVLQTIGCRVVNTSQGTVLLRAHKAQGSCHRAALMHDAPFGSSEALLQGSQVV